MTAARINLGNEIDPLRLVVMGSCASALTALVLWVVVGDLLRTATAEFDAVCSGLVFYSVVSAPRRIVDARKIAQSREAVLLSSISGASARVIGSRNRVLLMLRSGDEEIRRALADVRKELFLGVPADQATSRASRNLASYSAANALCLAGKRSSTVSERGEESAGLEASGQMTAETKVPVFMTATFFTPIMLLLYAVFARVTEPPRLAELVALEVVVLDLALYLCS